MDAVTLMRMQYQFSHGVLEQTMDGLTSEQAHWAPAGKGMPIAAEYGHVITRLRMPSCVRCYRLERR